ncbi:hypothetical protein Leryth_015613, partial [Lithospermum erythrorhizon]
MCLNWCMYINCVFFVFAEIYDEYFSVIVHV